MAGSVRAQYIILHTCSRVYKTKNKKNKNKRGLQTTESTFAVVLLERSMRDYFAHTHTKKKYRTKFSHWIWYQNTRVFFRAEQGVNEQQNTPRGKPPWVIQNKKMVNQFISRWERLFITHCLNVNDHIIYLECSRYSLGRHTTMVFRPLAGSGSVRFRTKIQVPSSNWWWWAQHLWQLIH